MLQFIVRRLAAGIVLVAAVSITTFLVMYVNVDRVVRTLVGENASAEQVAARAHELGLDRPLVVQLGDWLLGAVRGDLGTSYFTSEPVVLAVANRMPVTLSLLAGALIILTVLSAVIGIFAGVRQGGAVDRIIQIASEILSSIPKFWLALMLVLVLAIQLRVFPATGYMPLSAGFGAWAWSILLPTVAIVLGELRVISMVRGSVADELRKDYVRTLRARGLGEAEILFVHVLRNASGPWLSLMSMKVVALIGGAVVIEQVFALPGIGSLATTAATGGDVPVLLGVVVFIAALITVIYIVFDVLTAWLNPKVRLS
jgi:peptide/nickel transport system permease protein